MQLRPDELLWPAICVPNRNEISTSNERKENRGGLGGALFAR